MTRLTWDDIGERYYETGIDRGVLYSSYSTSGIVPWNGLTAVEEDLSEETSEAFHIDGMKYLDAPSTGSYQATLKAFTYPDEFLEHEGVEVTDGILVDGFIPVFFNLSYRTKVGNDVDSVEHGYKIHIVYGLTAVADSKSYNTETESPNAMEFSWTIYSKPQKVKGYYPISHIIMDTRLLPKFIIEDVEEMLYGSDTSAPYLPDAADLIHFITTWMSLRITDHGDGTWSAKDHGEYITILDDTTFQIDAESAVYLDAVTYTITDMA